MRGKELAKLLTCIIDEQKLKWTKGALMEDEEHFCALGLLAKGAGAPDDMISEYLDEDDIAGDGALSYIPELNDDAVSFLDFIIKLSKDKRNFPVKRQLKWLKKRIKEWEKEEEGA